MTTEKFITRIAPTPSGYLHGGNMWNFVLTWLIAKSHGGEIRLRIDDMDTGRYREEYLDDIFAILKWLGLDYDRGPKDNADFQDHFSQKLRLPQYHQALKQLMELRVDGEPIVYACECSREKIRVIAAKTDNPKVYPGTCRHKKLELENPAFTLRLNVQATSSFDIKDVLCGPLPFDPIKDIGDFVIRQKANTPAYQLTSLLDDMTYGTTAIVRGMDLFASTGAQIVLAQHLGMDSFAKNFFVHHGLFTDAVGHKLSKSDQVVEIKTRKGSPPTPEPVFRYFSKILDMRIARNLQEMLAPFELQKIPKENFISTLNFGSL